MLKSNELFVVDALRGIFFVFLRRLSLPRLRRETIVLWILKNTTKYLANCPKASA